MRDKFTRIPQSKLDQWLTETLGFSRGNPFATTAADQERRLLPEFYVDVDGYERIKGEETMIVFAPRGGGKSALRIVLASLAAPIAPAAPVLAVEYTDFDSLLAKLHHQPVLAIEDYITHLLRAGTKALVAALCGDPTNELLQSQSAYAQEQRADRAAALIGATRSRLGRLVSRYNPALIEPEALYERFARFEAGFGPNWRAFRQAAQAQKLADLVAQTPLGTHDTAGLLADLNDYAGPDQPDQSSPREQVEAFTNLAHAAGFTLVQFLIDRLDENLATADNPERQADVIEPLLANLPLLETAGVAFKFFLSREARDALLERSTIRRDRLADQAVTVVWDTSRLKAMLDARLKVYSENRINDLAQLFQDVRHQASGKPVGEWVESEMLYLAQGSPRRLLLAGRLLCEAHLVGSQPQSLLAEADWRLAKRELVKRMPPTLRIRAADRVAYIGDRTINLTTQQHKILLALLESGGRCSREALVERVWDTTEGVTEVAVDRAISRLRKRLGDDSEQPIYLVTERGIGFRLKHFELEI